MTSEEEVFEELEEVEEASLGPIPEELIEQPEEVVEQPEEVEEPVVEEPEEGLIDVRYIGKYGRGHHKAYASGIGEVYYGQIVSVTQEQFNNAPKSDWVKIGNFCRHINMNGDLCWNERDGKSPFCSFHRQEFQTKALLKGE